MRETFVQTPGLNLSLQAISVLRSVFSLCVCELLVLRHCGMRTGLGVFVLNINSILRMAKVYSGVSGLSYELSQ